jgi:SAM-dependent methyltransferase
VLPKTRAQEQRHRGRKRAHEMGLIVAAIAKALDGRARPMILEFGSGDGFQIPYLAQLGDVVASDIYASDGILRMRDLTFVECSITRTPFSEGRFDIIFSNHVIEHVADLPQAFRELKRIGSSSCLYAFSVPTNVWLLLSIPAQYYTKAKRLLGRPVTVSGDGNEPDGVPVTAEQPGRGLLRRLLPGGHGLVTDFRECYERFRIEAWQRLFTSHGFEVVETKPLLLYGPSEWPVIPTMRNRGRLCSSVLFLLRKGGVRPESDLGQARVGPEPDTGDDAVGPPAGAKIGGSRRLTRTRARRASRS